MEILSSRVLLRPADHDATLAFYRDVLGLAVAREFPGGTVFFAGNGFVEVSGAREPGERTGVALWLQVRDLDVAARELAAHVVREPRTEPWGLREMWLADPDGVRIVVVEVPPDHPIRRDVRHD
ncbi:VOC family protein [Pseudonocardia sp. KRD-184]|uniref:VOC family protein n=1 Tax=Pseudonocardia oceani TaxID=2792013 RepID=A0ABS6UCS6_9PSEU|nr:VOC family protein [Pseudonocardia oceani]MBW0088576.1 VOC family protein [Pseudonocardia oceani]MBW0094431.1 VOC family protein [Pseudonocardia oceani]MBW0108164.1 VOC family protein [Pseudonocardia oceani]MBW0119962.1 VOC family protein [Pseudonocardia oceani]MBW0130042.1 VOC family protein [Pseudonocardia oceani]